MKSSMELGLRLSNAATQWDIKQSRRAGYNPYALAMYLESVDEALVEIQAGADPKTAIERHFIGSLRTHMLKVL